MFETYKIYNVLKERNMRKDHKEAKKKEQYKADRNG